MQRTERALARGAPLIAAVPPTPNEGDKAAPVPDAPGIGVFTHIVP